VTLSRRVFGLALLNLVLIALVLAIFAAQQFGLSFESLMLGPARDRIAAIVNGLNRDLDFASYDQRNEVLARYARTYGVDLFLVGRRGESLAGPAGEIPQAVMARIPMRPPGVPDGGMNGPPEMNPPPDGEMRPLPGRGFAPGGPRGGRGMNGPGPLRPAFLVVTRNPMRFWVGVPIRTREPGPPGVLLLRSNTIFNSRLFFDWTSLLWVGAALAVVMFGCWWPFLHGITRSVQQMDRATEQIAEGHFDSHVAVNRSDELGHLGGQINRMAQRLEGFVKHQKRFLGDIAHELSAPIARIQFALGILEQKMADAPQEHVAVLREEVEEMSGLVNELLMFSKAGMQPGERPVKSLELAPVVERAVARQLLGPGRIETSVAPGLRVMANEDSLVRALSNLLRNSLRYAGDAGPITVTAKDKEGRVEILVEDCGPGLPEGALEEVFAPFYRPESSRSRETGGVGLGLAIVKSCVEECRGTVVCRNRRPSGLQVVITLPAAS
jgi:two-component system sensor histidine kinase CpxA